MEYLTEEEPISHKILFTGLDTAGKSSIIQVLKREFSKIAKIQPTKGAHRRVFTLLDREVSEWDLGGQKTYRISYLKNPGKFFDDTEIAMYVIDIRNDERMNEALSYLQDVINQFIKLKINPPINVFFHKCDPSLVRSSQDKLNNYITELTDTIKNYISYEPIHFFQTSIYDTYSLMNAMSQILLELYPKSQLLQKTIEEFAKKLNCEGLMIIDDNTLVIGAYYENDGAKLLLNKSIGYFLTLNDNFLEMGLGDQEDQFLIHKLGKYFLFKQFYIKFSVQPYYALILKSHNPFDLYFLRKEYTTFINVMNEIISK
ncbi:MAG: ADP-ribosylation factor-like protein [Candidatus Thorarchaeota archaeon]